MATELSCRTQKQSIRGESKKIIIEHIEKLLQGRPTLSDEEKIKRSAERELIESDPCLISPCSLCRIIRVKKDVAKLGRNGGTRVIYVLPDSFGYNK